MIKRYFIYFIVVCLCNIQSLAQENIDSVLRRSIVPIIKVGTYSGPEGWLLKFPVGTAFIIKDSSKYSNRLFLITARHVIENDSITICLINFSNKESNSETSTLVRKYVIKKNEWKFHTRDSISNGIEVGYSGFDIAVAELHIFRIQLESMKLWNTPLKFQWLLGISENNLDSAKVIAFPFVQKFNFDRGLAMGDLETDEGIVLNKNLSRMTFDKDKHVKDLNELLIKNPKFRPGYSGGLVYSIGYKNNENVKVLGMAMGMSNIRKNDSNNYCVAFYIKAKNILDVIYQQFQLR